MKTQHFSRVSIARGATALLILPFQMMPIAEGATSPQDIEVEDIARLCVRVNHIGETGLGRVIRTEGETRYEIDGSELRIHLAPVDREGDMTVIVDGSYGQVRLHSVTFISVKQDAESEVEASTYIFDAIAAGGGGADYKTDMYMDGAGRVVVERSEDGSTMLLDEHENPIVKRNADGSTQYFDAYQSARLMISADGNVEIAYTESGVTKTLALAERILASVTRNANNSVKLTDSGTIGECAYSTISGRDCSLVNATYSHADGYMSSVKNCSTAHAEGSHTIAEGDASHTEGYYCKTNKGLSHAEGNYCETGTNGGSAHAEGSYTNANGTASHTEGYRTITTEGGSHAQGCWNKVEGGAYAFMHGCGADDATRKNAFLIAGDEVYMLGVGGYDGTNYGQEGVQSVQSVIRALQLKLVNL